MGSSDLDEIFMAIHKINTLVLIFILLITLLTKKSILLIFECINPGG